MLKNNDEMFNKGVIWAKNVIIYNDIIFGSVAKKVGNPCEARESVAICNNRYPRLANYHHHAPEKTRKISA